MAGEDNPHFKECLNTNGITLYGIVFPISHHCIFGGKGVRDGIAEAHGPS